MSGGRPNDLQAGSMWPARNELEALGAVVQAASGLEFALRQAFCALVGSKYASVVVGTDQAAQLVEKCKELTKAQREISEDRRQLICDLLNDCENANKARNRLVHDMWAVGPGAVSHQLQRQRRGYGISNRPVTADHINRIASDLTSASVHLSMTLIDVLGPERATLESQLRWEDQVAAMSPQEHVTLIKARLKGMLSELARLLAKYGEQSWADLAQRLQARINSDLRGSLSELRTAFEGENQLLTIVLSGEPDESLPTYLRNLDPNIQLAQLIQQILQAVAYLETGDQGPNCEQPEAEALND